MRKVLLSAVALTGLVVATQFAGAGEAQAQVLIRPVAVAPAVESGLIQPVQYDWRWRQRHEYWRWHRHEEWRHRYWAYHHRW